MLEIPLLSFIIWMPIIIGFLMLIFNNDKNFSFINKNLSLLTSTFSLYLCYLLYRDFNFSTWKMQFVENKPWIPSLGIFYSLGIDGISIALVLLTCFMTFIVILYS